MEDVSECVFADGSMREREERLKCHGVQMALIHHSCLQVWPPYIVYIISVYNFNNQCMYRSFCQSSGVIVM